MDSRVSVSRELYHAFGVEYLKFLLVLSSETFLLHCRLIQSCHVGVAYAFSAIYRLPSMLKQVAVAPRRVRVEMEGPYRLPSQRSPN